jgi:hypothetical protein
MGWCLLPAYQNTEAIGEYLLPGMTTHQITESAKLYKSESPARLGTPIE